MTHGTKKLKPKIKDFRKVLVEKDGKKLKAYALFIKGKATRYRITLPKLNVPIQDNIEQIWVDPQGDITSLPEGPKQLIHGKTAFLESGIHDYHVTTRQLDYFGMALSGNTWFYLILKDQ